MIRAGHAIALCVLALLMLGVVMVNSAGMNVGGPAAGRLVTLETVIFSKSTVFMVLALLSLALASRLPIDRLIGSAERARWVPMLIPLTLIALAMVYMPVIGKEVNGSRRWIVAPGTTMQAQPSEIAKWAVVLLAAWLVVRQGERVRTFSRGFVPGVCLVGVFAAVVAKEDLGTGALIFASGSVVLLAAGVRVLHFMSAVPVVAVGLVAAIIDSPYRLTRLTTFLDPFADPEKAGFHMVQSLVAVSNGEVFGRGLGFGLQKFGYLPEDTTDFVFAIICEELGVAGAALVVFLYITALWSGWSIVKRQSAPMLRLVGLGVLVTFGMQAAINLLVVTGLAPTKGIALPLVSSGGTGWILTAGSLGLLMAMDRLDARRESAGAVESSDSAGLPGIAAHRVSAA